MNEVGALAREFGTGPTMVLLSMLVLIVSAPILILLVRAQNRRTQEDAANMAAIRNQMVSLQTQVLALQDKLDEQDGRNHQLTASNEKLNAKIAELERQLRDATDKVKALEARDIRNDEALRQRDRELAELRQKLDAMQRHVDMLQQEKNALADKLTAEQKKTSDQESRLKEARAEIQQLKERVAAISAENATLQRVLERLEARGPAVVAAVSLGAAETPVIELPDTAAESDA